MHSSGNGNLFTATKAVDLLGKWMAEYSAHFRTVYWAKRPEGDERSVVKGFRDTSEAWKGSLTRARARADAQYRKLARAGSTERDHQKGEVSYWASALFRVRVKGCIRLEAVMEGGREVDHLRLRRGLKLVGKGKGLERRFRKIKRLPKEGTR